MADYDQEGNPIGAVQKASPMAKEHGNIAWAHLMYALHALSAASGVLTSASIAGAFVFGWPSLLAVILNYATRGNVRGSWLESHWRWQLRTFWFAALWLCVAGLLALTLIGIPAAIAVIVVTGLWVLYRVVRGWLALGNRQSMPLPA
ncbi:MAG: hypothetical protein N2441_00870 [Rhodocyclaceae bacterium]|nr:hypothetical protein [Rhodocyclaceae bacterium]